MSISSGKKVAIIGSGPSGLIATFHILKECHDLTIFEKNPEIGGVWSSVGYSWPSMTTNISKYCMGFMNFQWREYDEVFPSKEAVRSFFFEIAEKTNIKSKIRLNTMVQKVELLENGEFKIISEDLISKKTFSEIFDFVIVCTGLFSKPEWGDFSKYLSSPDITLSISHVSQYESPLKFKGKKVVVVGHGHSAAQIASELTCSAEKIINIFRKPHWIAKKSNYSEKYKKSLPNDLSLFSTKREREANSNLNNFEKDKIRYQGLHAKTKQNECGVPELFMEKDFEGTSASSICDYYLENVKNGLIKPIRSEITSISGKTISLKNGEVLEADEIILGLGYSINWSFLDEKIQEILNYDPSGKKRLTLNLEGNYTFNSKIKNLAFVGFTPFDAITTSWEFQAIVALNYFKFGANWEEYKKKFKVYSKEEIDYKDLLDFNEKISEEAEFGPDYALIEQEDKELFDMIMNSPFHTSTVYFNRKNLHTNAWKENSDCFKKFYKDLNRGFFI